MAVGAVVAGGGAGGGAVGARPRCITSTYASASAQRAEQLRVARGSDRGERSREVPGRVVPEAQDRVHGACGAWRAVLLLGAGARERGVEVLSQIFDGLDAFEELGADEE